VKPVGVPGAFLLDVDPAADVEPVDAVGFVDAVGAALDGAAVDGGAELGVEPVVVGVLDVVASLAPVTPALRGDDEL
jgi:hypothetical protein